MTTKSTVFEVVRFLRTIPTVQEVCNGYIPQTNTFKLSDPLSPVRELWGLARSYLGGLEERWKPREDLLLHREGKEDN